MNMDNRRNYDSMDNRRNYDSPETKEIERLNAVNEDWREEYQKLEKRIEKKDLEYTFIKNQAARTREGFLIKEQSDRVTILTKVLEIQKQREEIEALKLKVNDVKSSSEELADNNWKKIDRIKILEANVESMKQTNKALSKNVNEYYNRITEQSKEIMKLKQKQVNDANDATSEAVTDGKKLMEQFRQDMENGFRTPFCTSDGAMVKPIDYVIQYENEKPETIAVYIVKNEDGSINSIYKDADEAFNRAEPVIEINPINGASQKWNTGFRIERHMVK